MQLAHTLLLPYWCHAAAVLLLSCGCLSAVLLLTHFCSQLSCFCLAEIVQQSCSFFCFCLVILLLSCRCLAALAYFFFAAVLLLSCRCLISFFLLLCCSALLLSCSCLICIFLVMSYCSHTGFIRNLQYDILYCTVHHCLSKTEHSTYIHFLIVMLTLEEIIGC